MSHFEEKDLSGKYDGIYMIEINDEKFYIKVESNHIVLNDFVFKCLEKAGLWPCNIDPVKPDKNGLIVMTVADNDNERNVPMFKL
jgi:hypothetical protein